MDFRTAGDGGPSSETHSHAVTAANSPAHVVDAIILLMFLRRWRQFQQPPAEPEWNPSWNLHSEREGDFEHYGADHLTHIDSAVKPVLTAEVGSFCAADSTVV